MRWTTHYKQIAGLKKLKSASTPFCPKGSLVHADDCSGGELMSKACSVLMKNLWAGRLARPECQKPITDPASNLQCRSKNDDEKLHRLMCFLGTKSHYRLIGKVHDDPSDLKLLLFVYADFCGDPLHTWLVLAGPNTWFLSVGSNANKLRPLGQPQRQRLFPWPMHYSSRPFLNLICRICS